MLEEEEEQNDALRISEVKLDRGKIHSHLYQATCDRGMKERVMSEMMESEGVN